MYLNTYQQQLYMGNILCIPSSITTCTSTESLDSHSTNLNYTYDTTSSDSNYLYTMDTQ